MNKRLSDYSIHYRDMDPEGVERARESMKKRLESFRHRLDLELILPRIKGPDVLDFPIGTGRFYPELIGKVNVFGYDISKRYIEHAQENHPEIADHFSVCSFEEISHERRFDTIVTLRTLNNINDIDLAIGNVSSILKPHGRWIFNYPKSGPDFVRLPDILRTNGITVIERRSYDFITSIRTVSRPIYAVYSRFVSLVERGLVPYRVFRVAERLLGRYGTVLFVCEKTN